MKYTKTLPGKIIREEFNRYITGDSVRLENGYKQIKVEYDEIRSAFNTESSMDSFSFSGTAFLFDKNKFDKHMFDKQDDYYENVGRFTVEYDVERPDPSTNEECTIITYTTETNNDYWLSIVCNLFPKKQD